MKRSIIVIILLLIIGSAVALGYTLYESGMVGSKTTETGTPALSEEEARIKNLEWMKNIRGYADDTDEENEETTSSTEEIVNATSTDAISNTTSTILTTSEPSEVDATSTDITPEEDDKIDTKQEENDIQEGDRVRGIESLGKADALESTVYDHGFTQLITSAELASNSITLEWTPSTSDVFVSYIVIRSANDENPYPPKTKMIKTISDKSVTTYTDLNVEKGDHYFYRICSIREGKNPTCGNILSVQF